MVPYVTWFFHLLQVIPRIIFEKLANVQHNLISPIPKWDPEKDMPDLSGRVVIVTGGNSGLGKASIEILVKRGATVYMASRSRDKAIDAIDAIKSVHRQAKLHFLELDLASLASVKNAAEEFLSKETQLHILINNAGVMALPFQLTSDGLEIHWQTNYVSHFLFTKLLLPTMLRTAVESPSATVRIVNLTSQANHFCRGIDYENTASAVPLLGPWFNYNQSKLANVLHAKALAKSYGDKNILSVSVHPGFVLTNLQKPVNDANPIAKLLMGGSRPYILAPKDGALTQLWAATSPELTLMDGGKYYAPFMRESVPPAAAGDEKEVDDLWRYTGKLLEEKGY